MNASSIEVDPFSRLIGRLETEIEIYAHHIFGCTPEELTARIGAVFIGITAQPQLHVEEMPGVRSKTTQKNHRLRKVALGNGPHSKRAPSVKGSWWWKLSQAERAAITAKRVASNKKRSKTKTRNSARIAA